MNETKNTMQKQDTFIEDLRFIDSLVNKGGPDVEDYPAFEAWLGRLVAQVQCGELSPDQIHELRSAFGESLSPETIQGFMLNKPHGYAGDFEMIDRIYQMHKTDEPHLQKWDTFSQSRKPAQAVRNRKTYFIDLLKQLESSNPSQPTLYVLNVASGPGRDLYEYFSGCDSEKVSFDCVENDPKAIAHAANLCEKFLHRIKFYQANALRFTSPKKYQLVWSAGLFDYFNDKTFKLLLKRLYRMVQPGGELVIGNFSEKNPSQGYMELLGEWILQHRSKDHLIALAQECEIDRELIHVGEEPEGVNLFLHIKKP